MGKIPSAIADALRHVRAFHPDVVRVVYFQEDCEHGGAWRFETSGGNVPAFGPEININLLETALDVAWQDQPFPATYSIE